jgi:hypothetical protein
LDERRLFWRFWGGLALGTAAALATLLAVAVLALWLFGRPDYRATLVVVSEVPVVLAEAVYEGRAVAPTVIGGEPPYVVVWEDLRPRYKTPRLVLRLRLEGGGGFVLHQVMHHQPNWPRCLYTLHIDADGMVQADRARGSRMIGRFCPGEGDGFGY